MVSSGNQVFTRLQDLNHPSLVSLGGGARRANNYLIDGVPHTDLVNRPSVNPSFEAVESVNVQLHTYDAETGRTGGGTYNVPPDRAAASTRGALSINCGRARWLPTTSSRARRLAEGRHYFHNSGGGIGGPIVPNRTFFWY